MWRRAVLVQTMLLLAGAWDLTYYTRTRLYPPVPRVECFDYPDPEWSLSGRQSAVLTTGRIPGGRANLLHDGGFHSRATFGLRSAVFRRMDSFPFSFSNEDIVKEHAKLVQDINGLRQGSQVQAAPIVDKAGDYDYSIYLEEIDTSTTARPAGTSLPPSGKKREATAMATAVPVFVVGAVDRRPSTVVGSWPARSPERIRRPYPPFSPTVRVCLPPAPPSAPLPYPKPTPNLLQRLINGIISK